VDTPDSVPLYRCSGCGFVTTASLADAERAHAAGAPDCPVGLELAADFSRIPQVLPFDRSRPPRDGAAGAPKPSDERLPS
jgi:hypothetical protein